MGKTMFINLPKSYPIKSLANKYMSIFRQTHITIIGIFLLVMHNTASGEDIEILSVSVTVENDIEIQYLLHTDNITKIGVRYTPDPELGSDTIHTHQNINQQLIQLKSDDYNFPVSEQVLYFQLEGYDNNDSFVASSKIHSTIFFKTLFSDSEKCTLAVNISWFNYAVLKAFNAIQEPLHFESLYVYATEFSTDCSFTDEDRINAIPIDITMGLQEEILIFNRTPGKYCFRLEASNTDNQIATSNTIVTDIDDFDVPVHIEILSVNVIANETIEIQLEVDTFGFSEFEYRLYRTHSQDEDFVEIDRKDHSSGFLSFTDNQVPNFDVNPWYYLAKVDIKDCPGDHTKETDPASSVFLEANLPDDFNPASANEVPVNLSWKHLPEWDQYELFSLESTGVTLIETFNAPPYEYSHQINIEGLTETVLSFRLEATKGSLKVHSNIAQVRIEPILFLPRASGQRHALLPSSELFIDGEYPNRFFRPTFVFPYINYIMNIYDRNGQLVFSTNDDSEPWDGTINGPNGNPAPAGAYVFEVRLTDIGGTSHEKKGVVYLIR